MGLPVKAIHSDLEQNEREVILRDFKNKQLKLLIGTDVLSRGIDVEGIGLVVNYDVPPDPEDYIHRIGRTARAESTGIAATFINPADQVKFSRIERLIGREIEKTPLPEGFTPSFAYHPVREKNSQGHSNRPDNKRKFFKNRPAKN